MNLLSKRKYSRKLHYGKYLYKINLFNELGFIFRGDLNNTSKESFPYARAKLDEYRAQFDQGEKIIIGRFRASKPLSYDDFASANKLYHILCEYNNDVKVRIEYFYNMWVYTSSEQCIMDIVQTIPESVVEYWMVDPKIKEVLSREQNLVLTKQPPEHEYKIYLNSNLSKYTLIANWLTNNTDKSKIGLKTLECLQKEWVTNNYFYVKNEKVLLLIQMIAGDSISRVERLIYERDVDKYSYELKQ